MRHTEEHIDELIAAFLSGNADDAQCESLKKWLDESEEHLEHFHKSSHAFHLAAQNTAWQRAYSEFKRETRPRRKYLYFAAAATFALLVGIRIFFATPGEALIAQSGNESITRTLPDGITAILSPHSALKQVNSSGSRNRYSLEGVATFEVHGEKSIEVLTDDLVIEDIGTVFRVSHISGDSITSVEIQEGRVRVTTSLGSIKEADAGETIRYNRLKKQFSLIHSAPESAGKILKFDNQSLAEIIGILQEEYDLRIQCSPSLSGCRLTVTFRNESPEIILGVITETLQARLTIEGTNYFIQGEHCD